MRAKIDAETCTGCTLCTTTSPEVFKMEVDKAVVCVDVVPEASEEACKTASEECPVGAITIE